jgi:glycosyltransferase involved in cell wall biosynthesis
MDNIQNNRPYGYENISPIKTKFIMSYREKQLSRKERVLFIGPCPPPYSGPEISMELFLNSSLKEKYDIVFLKTNFRKDNVNKGRLDIRMASEFFRYMSRLVVLLVFRRPKVVYYPITPTAIGWIGRDFPTLFLVQLMGLKSIIHLRGSHFKLNLSKFPTWLRRMVRYCCSKVKVAIVQAEYLRDEFAGLVPEERIKVLYQAIDTREFENQDISSYEKGNILFVGHLTQAKGFCDLMKVLPIVVERCPDCRVVVAGNIRRGERGVFFNQYDKTPLAYADPFEAEAEVLNGPYATSYCNCGVISGEEKLEVFKSCQIFVSPSYSEGFSRSLLEAMSLGKALVYTPVGAHREVLGSENGIQVLPGDHEALANAMIRLLSDPELCRKIGQHNYCYARENFDIKTIADDFSNIIEEVIHD